MDEISERRVPEAEALASELRGFLNQRFERLEAQFAALGDRQGTFELQIATLARPASEPRNATARKAAEHDERLGVILGRIEAVEQRLYRVEQEAAANRHALGDMAQRLDAVAASLEKLARRGTRR